MTLAIPRSNYTNSSLVEWVIKSWKHYKSEQYPIPGDHYYNQIISGVYLNRPILISSSHLPNELANELEQCIDNERNKIITRSIKEFFAEICGNGVMRQAEKEKRFQWRFLK